MCVIKKIFKAGKAESFHGHFIKAHVPLTSVMAGTVYCGVILLLVPLRVLLFTRKRRAHFCHLTGVPTESARVHGAPV